MRYELEKGSGTNHCCFSYTIRDTQKPTYGFKGNFISYEIVCECLDEEYAKLILEALNKGDR